MAVNSVILCKDGVRFGAVLGLRAFRKQKATSLDGRLTIEGLPLENGVGMIRISEVFPDGAWYSQTIYGDARAATHVGRSLILQGSRDAFAVESSAPYGRSVTGMVTVYERVLNTLWVPKTHIFAGIEGTQLVPRSITEKELALELYDPATNRSTLHWVDL